MRIGYLQGLLIAIFAAHFVLTGFHAEAKYEIVSMLIGAVFWYLAGFVDGRVQKAIDTVAARRAAKRDAHRKPRK